ncbi:MAG TPA: DUF309 domain-containing protein [Kofleriaceae bacterium]
MTDRDHLLELGAAALAAGDWLAAHEHWEQAWRRTGPDDRHAVQALAQLAAALVHLSRGRPRGAARVLAKAQRKLARPATPATIGPIDVALVRRQSDRLSDDLAAGRTPDLSAIRIA